MTDAMNLAGGVFDVVSTSQHDTKRPSQQIGSTAGLGSPSYGSGESFWYGGDGALDHRGAECSDYSQARRLLVPRVIPSIMTCALDQMTEKKI